MNLSGLLAMFGYTTDSAARELERAGYGNATSLKRALDSGDKQALGFIPEVARQVQKTSPDLMSRIRGRIHGAPESGGY